MKKQRLLTPLITALAAFSVPVYADLLQTNTNSSLVKTAENELNNSITLPKDNSQSKLSTSVLPETTQPSFLVAEKPVLEDQASSPTWFLSLGIENQRPQGTLEFDGLSPVALGDLDGKSSLVFQLDWWFAKGDRFNTGLFAETSWSQHSYNIQVSSNLTDSSAGLDVFRATIGAQSQLKLDTWLPTSMTRPGISYSFGTHLAFGRLLQVQSSEDSNQLNRSLGLNHLELGPSLSAVFANRFLMNLSYGRRWAVSSDYESSHHGQLSFGMSL